MVDVGFLDASGGVVDDGPGECASVFKPYSAGELVFGVGEAFAEIGEVAVGVDGVEADVGSRGEVEDCRLLLSRDVCPSDSVNLCKMTIMRNEIGPGFQRVSSDPNVVRWNGTPFCSQGPPNSRVMIGGHATCGDKRDIGAVEERLKLLDISLDARALPEAIEQFADDDSRQENLLGRAD